MTEVVIALTAIFAFMLIGFWAGRPKAKYESRDLYSDKNHVNRHDPNYDRWQGDGGPRARR